MLVNSAGRERAGRSRLVGDGELRHHACGLIREQRFAEPEKTTRPRSFDRVTDCELIARRICVGIVGEVADKDGPCCRRRLHKLAI